MNNIYDVLANTDVFDVASIREKCHIGNNVDDILLKTVWKYVHTDMVTGPEECLEALGIDNVEKPETKEETKNTNNTEEKEQQEILFSDLLIEIINVNAEKLNKLQAEGNAQELYKAVHEIIAGTINASVNDACVSAKDVEPEQSIEEQAHEIFSQFFGTADTAKANISWLKKDLVKKGATPKRGYNKEAINFINMHMVKSAVTELLFKKWLRDIKLNEVQEKAVEKTLNYLCAMKVLRPYYVTRGGARQLSGFTLMPGVMLKAYCSDGRGLTYQVPGTTARYVLYTDCIYEVKTGKSCNFTDDNRQGYIDSMSDKLFIGFAGPMQQAQ